MSELQGSSGARNTPEKVRYIAFISYRHLPWDGAVAEELARQIEQFVVPKALRKNGQRKPGTVFRDKDELPLSSSLRDDLYTALDASEYLIVVCSPELMESRYCMEELRYFLTHHSQDRVLTVLVRGKPEESFPPVLLTRTDPETGEVRDVEPLAADVTGPSVKDSLKKLKKEKIRILASLLGCKYDDLNQRNRKRRRKLFLGWAAAFCAVAAAFGLTLSGVIRTRNEEQQKRLLSEARLLLQESEAQTEAGRSPEGAQAALRAVELARQGGFSLENRDYCALAAAAAAYETEALIPYRAVDFGENVDQIRLSEDGKTILAKGRFGQWKQMDLQAPPQDAGWSAVSGEEGPAADGQVTTLDGKVSAEILPYTPSFLQSGGDGQTKKEPLAEVQVHGGASDSLIYQLPDPNQGTLVSTKSAFLYICPTGIYLLDPEHAFPDTDPSQPFEVALFSDMGINAGRYFVKTSPRHIMLFPAGCMISIDRDTGYVIDLKTTNESSPVISCSWIDGEETRSVFVTDTGSCYFYYDEGRTPEDALVPYSFRYTGTSRNAVLRQKPLPAVPDYACVSRDGSGVILAAVSREDRKIIRLYSYMQNPRAEYLSLNEMDSALYTDRLAGGHLIRADRYEEGTLYLTLLRYGDGRYSETPFSLPEGFCGISPDLKTVYTTKCRAVNIESGEIRDLLTEQQRLRRESCTGWFGRTDESGLCRQLFFNDSPDGTVSVCVLAGDRVTWEDRLPCQGFTGYDDMDEGTAGTTLGENGWACTSVQQTDGSLIQVLTDLDGHRFVLPGGPFRREFSLGRNPEKPVMAGVEESRIVVRDCRTGEITADMPLPVEPDQVKDLALIQNDRYIFLVQTNLTVRVLDAADGAVLYTRAVPFNGTYFTNLILHLFETEGEFCYTFRNEGLAYVFAGEDMEKDPYYTLAYDVDTATWTEKWRIPRLHSVQYDANRAVIYDGAFRKCYTLPILTLEELISLSEGG